MNDASDQPVKKEAPPLVVGGAASKPVARKKPWRKIGIIIFVLVILAAIGGGVWWVMDQQANYLNISNLKSNDPHLAAARKLVDQPVPKDPKDRSIYYSTIAINLEAADEYTAAEHYMLTAQKVTDDNNLDKKEYRYYVALSAIYKKMGNTKKVDEYNKKEQAFLEANYSKEVLDEMRKDVPDAPHTN